MFLTAALSFKRDSQPELYPSSGESRCFLFVQVSTKGGASSPAEFVPPFSHNVWQSAAVGLMFKNPSERWLSNSLKLGSEIRGISAFDIHLFLELPKSHRVQQERLITKILPSPENSESLIFDVSV
ncbi:MAG: hypothetical protein WCD40_03240, partial [Candidatus Acidiferrales bacterium]